MRNTSPLSDQGNELLDAGANLARVRYQRIKAAPLEPVRNDEFFWATAAQDTFFLGPAPAPAKPPARVHPSAGLPSYLIHLYETPLLTREQELVVAMTKRYARSNRPLFELVSDGNVSLMRAVEKFDYARGIRFSTYATCAIIRNFAQAIACEFRDRARFRNAGTCYSSRCRTGGSTRRPKKRPSASGKSKSPGYWKNSTTASGRSSAGTMV